MKQPSIMVQARVSKELREEAENLFKSMGMSTSEAIRLFFQQVVNYGSLPFQIRAQRLPSNETLSSINELENGGGDCFENVDDMFKSWEK